MLWYNDIYAVERNFDWTCLQLESHEELAINLKKKQHISDTIVKTLRIGV